MIPGSMNPMQLFFCSLLLSTSSAGRGRSLNPEYAVVGHTARANDRRLQLLARHGQHEPELTLGRSNWLFTGRLRAGKLATAVMSLLHLARINRHDPHAYLKDVLSRLPLHPNNRVEELLPHRWRPAELQS